MITRVSQQGVALLSVLLVVALATIASVALVGINELAVQRSRNTSQSLQAAQYARGLEAWARIYLQRDLEESGYDSRTELWAVPLPALEVTGGAVTGRLFDLNGRFNLNALAAGSTVHQERFERLLLALDLNPRIAVTLADWLDEDGQARSDGAEDFFYLAQEPPYRAANRLMRHASELRLVAGVSAEAYAALEPYVTALPLTATLNVNTAPIPVLMALHPDISRPVAERIFDRGFAEFRGMEEFKQAAGLAVTPFDDSGLSVSSEYFLAQADIALGDTRKAYYSVLHRAGYSQFAVLERAVGRYEGP